MIKIKQIFGLAEALNSQQRFQAYNAAYSDNESDLKVDARAVWTKYSAYKFEITDWKFDVIEAPVGGSITIDIHKNGISILSEHVKITESRNMSNPAELISTPTLFDVGDKIEIFITDVGTSRSGRGLSGDPIGVLLPT